MRHLDVDAVQAPDNAVMQVSHLVGAVDYYVSFLRNIVNISNC